jgi:hypothetical protein
MWSARACSSRRSFRLNVLAGAVVLVGAALAVLLGWLLGMDAPAVLGMLSGATTNTPSLGAAQQTLATLPVASEDRAALPALAYAGSYPPAIAGIIGTLLALKAIFRIDPVKEAEAFAKTERGRVEPLESRTLVVENPNLAGVSIDAIPSRAETGVTVSWARHSSYADSSQPGPGVPWTSMAAPNVLGRSLTCTIRDPEEAVLVDARTCQAYRAPHDGPARASSSRTLEQGPGGLSPGARAVRRRAVRLSRRGLLGR